MTPCEAVYGKKPPSLTSYLPGTSKVLVVKNLLQQRECTLMTLKDNLAMSQNHMMQQADQHRYECSFEVGDLVFLGLQPYNKTSLEVQGH